MHCYNALARSMVMLALVLQVAPVHAQSRDLSVNARLLASARSSDQAGIDRALETLGRVDGRARHRVLTPCSRGRDAPSEEHVTVVTGDNLPGRDAQVQRLERDMATIGLA